MTTTTRGSSARVGGLKQIVMALAITLLGSGLARAEGEPPWLPQVSAAPMQVVVPAAPAAADAELVDRMAVDPINPARYSSQDFVVDFDDSQGADDFCIAPSVSAWTITHVDVVGAYNDNGYAVSSVNVFFLAGNGSLPGAVMYSATVTGANLANAASGSFAMSLPSPALLNGNQCYWLSVQAVQPAGYDAGETWQWTERTAASADHSPSAYRLPSRIGHACQNWGARLATCFPGSLTNPDFTFRLSGSISYAFSKVFIPIVRR